MPCKDRRGVVLLALFLSAVAAGDSASSPPDPLRSLWVLSAGETAEPFQRPAVLAAEGAAQTRLVMRYHDLFRLADPGPPVRVSAWETGVGQILPAGPGRLWLRGLRPGAAVHIPFDRSRTALSPEAVSRVELAYGLAAGSWLAAGVSTAWRGAVPRGEGMLHVRLSPWPGSALEGWAGRQLRQQRLGVRLEERPYDLQLRNQARTWGGRFAGGLAGWGEVRAGWEREAIRPHPALSPYTADLACGVEVWQVGGGVPVAAGYALAGELRGRRLAGELRGYLEGERFAQGEPRFEDRAASLTLRRAAGSERRWEVGIFANTGRFRLRSGRLENWPFLASSLSLVEGKLWSFWGRGGYRLHGGALEWEHRGTAWDWTLGSRFVRAEGWAYLSSRERRKASFASLLFPHKQERFLEKRWELMDLTLGVGYRRPGWGIGYRIDQLVPLRTAPAGGAGWEEQGGGRHCLTVWREN